MAKPSRSKKTPAFKAIEKRRVRAVWGSALGAAVGSLMGSAVTHNPDMIGQGILALQLQFEGQGRSKEQADVLHFLLNNVESFPTGTPGRDVVDGWVSAIKAGAHVGTADVAHSSLIEEFLSKMNPIPQDEWVRDGKSNIPASPSSPKKGRKS